MEKNLIYHWLNLCCFKKTCNIFNLEIGNSDCLKFSCLISILKSFPCRAISLYISIFALINLCPRLRTVNNHHIKIIQSHFPSVSLIPAIASS